MFRESLPTMRAIKVAVGDVLNIFTGCEKYVSAEYFHFLKNAFFELSQNAFLYNMFPLQLTYRGSITVRLTSCLH